MEPTGHRVAWRFQSASTSGYCLHRRMCYENNKEEEEDELNTSMLISFAMLPTSFTSPQGHCEGARWNVRRQVAAASCFKPGLSASYDATWSAICPDEYRCWRVGRAANTSIDPQTLPLIRSSSIGSIAHRLERECSCRFQNWPSIIGKMSLAVSLIAA